MQLVPWLLVFGMIVSGQTDAGSGVVRGVVVRTRDRMPVPGAKILLRVQVDGQFVPAAETSTGVDGAFALGGLPVGPELVYLPGANRDGIHYPGPRVRLTRERPIATVELHVCDSVTEPSPLVIREHEVFIRPEPGSLAVTETILLENPGPDCYVGRPTEEGGEPVTLALSIPSDFERVTFDQEFYGRRFSLRSGKLVTAIPFTPGPRRLRFTYWLRNEDRHRVWQRRLDLRTANLRVVVEGDGKEIDCNLQSAQAAEPGRTAFAASGELAAGYVVRVELGRLARPWHVYGRWGAVAVLGGLVAACAARSFRKTRRLASTDPASAGPPKPASKGLHRAGRSRRLSASRRRRASR
jgi:hypothetical protein